MTVLPKMRKYNKFVGNEIAVDVKDGRLLLFPAWLPHGVPVNPDEQERISISFNNMFSGFTEAMSRSLWRGKVGPRIRS